MKFGEYMVLLRKQLKMSQDDLAKKVGTSAPIIGAMNGMRLSPPLIWLKK